MQSKHRDLDLRPIISEKPSLKKKEALNRPPVLPWKIKEQEIQGKEWKYFCYHCRKTTVMKGKTPFMHCPECGEVCATGDIVLSLNSKKKNIFTQDNIYVLPHTLLTGVNLCCKKLVLEGKVSGSFYAYKAIYVNADVDIQGNIKTSLLYIKKNCHCCCHSQVYTDNIDVWGELRANVLAKGTLRIRRGGKVVGSIVASRFILDEGGIHEGNVLDSPFPMS